MNKQDWTYKKLGEVCEDKKQIVRASNLFLPNEIINYIDISSIDNSQNIISSTTPYSFNDAPSRAQQVVKIGDVLISLVRPNLRNIAIVNSQNENLVASSGFCILRTKDGFNNRYLFYIIRGNKFTNHLLGRVQGANYPAVREDDIKNYLIPVPPIGEQERIVAELDLLQGIIEKKKEQLKAYDQLAQSIFYTMFGDPIDNPKGWEYIKLSSFINDNVILYHLDGNHGGDYPRSDEFVNEGVPYIGANCICDGLINFSMAKYLPIDRANKLRKGLAKNGDVLFAHNATVGPVAYLKTKEPLVILSTSLTAYRCNENKLNPLFLRAYMQSTWFESQYKVSMKQTTRNQIPITQQKKMNFILPPLSLQQEFAEKVEAIERQKALVQQSIDEMQTMFDYTMDKYFG